MTERSEADTVAHRVQDRIAWVTFNRPEKRNCTVAGVLLQKNPVALKFTKDAMRRVGEMSFDDAEDYLVRCQEAADSFDRSGRQEGLRQFLDEKSYQPGLGSYDSSRKFPGES